MRGDQSVGQRPDCDVDVEIPVGAVVLQGHLHLPEPADSVVLFAHGSGSSRHSPRNQFVASALYRAGIGTLLLDLLTAPEELERVRHGSVRDPAHRSNAVAPQPVRLCIVPRRILRCEHWSRRGVAGGR